MLPAWRPPNGAHPVTDEDIMTKFFLLAATAAALAVPAHAADPAAGEEAFKKCKACHSVIAPDGTEIQKGGRTGPNLYGVIGRAVASDPDFRYGESIAALGATGAVWDAASFAAYTADPAGYLQSALGDAGAKSKMSFKLASGGEDIAAYLASVSQ
jgi:cytochrome c